MSHYYCYFITFKQSKLPFNFGNLVFTNEKTVLKTLSRLPWSISSRAETVIKCEEDGEVLMAHGPGLGFDSSKFDTHAQLEFMIEADVMTAHEKLLHII